MKLTDRERLVLDSVRLHSRKHARWYRAHAQGERVTLASLWRKGYLERRAWRGVAPYEAHEYRFIRLSGADGEQPELESRAREGTED